MDSRSAGDVVTYGPMSFCAIALLNCGGGRPTFTEPAELAPGIELRHCLPFSFEELWHLEASRLEKDVFGEPNLVVVARSPDALWARKAAHLALWSLIPFGAARFGYGHYCEGVERTSSDRQLTAIARVDPCLAERGLRMRPLTDDLVAEARPATAHLIATGEGNWVRTRLGRGGAGEYERLSRGFKALVEGTTVSGCVGRIKKFVNALEAMVRPPVSRATRTFAHRANMLASRTEESQQTLLECYHLRSCEDHLDDWRDILGDYDDPPATLRLRSAQTEFLACEAYRRVLCSDDLRETFVSDSSIATLWGDGGRPPILDTWGEPIRIESEALAESRIYRAPDR